MVRLWTGFIWLRVGAVAVCCKHGNEYSYSVNCWEILDHLRKY
jgi:hypothetical protein